MSMSTSDVVEGYVVVRYVVVGYVVVGYVVVGFSTSEALVVGFS